VKKQNLWKRMVVLCAIGVSLWAIASCSGPADSTAGETGTIILAVPGLAPYVGLEHRDLESSGTLKPQAWLLASFVDFYLYNSSGSLIDSVSVSAGVTYTDWEVQVGSGYEIEAYVYNSQVSSSTPVVWGIETGISVLADSTTTVTVTCFPYSPITVPVGGSSSNYTLDQAGERWFRVLTDSSTTTFAVTSTGSSDTGLYVFGPDGLFIIESDTTATTDQVTITTSSGSYYYLGVLEYSTAQDPFYVTVPSGGDDAYEENDTLATAYGPITESTWYTGYQWDQDWFEIDVTSGYNEVLIECDFSSSAGDIDIALIDSDGYVLQYGTEETWGEWIDCIVDAAGGTHYIVLYNGNAGNAWDLWWDDVQPPGGNGYIDVGIQ
jgi:hypothetical protein